MSEMIKIKTIGSILICLLYVSAGINHLIHPDAYYAIIPPYLPFHYLINITSGITEIILGSLILFSKTKTVAAYGIIVLLILFIPAHVYMIQKGGCMSEKICIPLWAAWLRLFPLQFILMLWAWWHRK